MKSTHPSVGESLENPFYFLYQVHNTVNTIKADRLAGYASVTVNVYLGKGDHFLFDCASTDPNVMISGISGVTDFCAEISTL